MLAPRCSAQGELSADREARLNPAERPVPQTPRTGAAFAFVGLAIARSTGERAARLGDRELRGPQHEAGRLAQAPIASIGAADRRQKEQRDDEVPAVVVDLA